MAKTVLVTLMALLASTAAQPLLYGGAYYSYGSPYTTAAYTAAYGAQPVAAAALSAPAVPAAVIPAPAAYNAAFNAPFSLPALSAYTGYSLQEQLAPTVVNPAAAPFVLGLPYSAYPAAEYAYGR